MRYILISIIVLFSLGLNAQPKPYQETLTSIEKIKIFLTGRPFPKYTVTIYHNFSILFVNEHYVKSDKPFDTEKIKVVDSISIRMEKADFIKLVAAYRELDFDSLYVPEKKSEDSLVLFISGGLFEEYIIKTSKRTFTIGEGMERGETYSESLQNLIWAIKDVEAKYKPEDFIIHYH